MNETYSLGIVQSHLTQFDGPLFRKLAACPDLKLTAYLTHPDGNLPSYDSELGHTSGWDHDFASGYHFRVRQTRYVESFRFAHQIASAGHDLVIVAGYSSPISLLISWSCKLHHVPVGLRSDSVFLYRTKPTWKWRLKDVVLPVIFRLYTTGHPVGSLARFAMVHYGIPSEAIFLFPYAADNDYLRQRFESIAPQRAQLRSQLGIGPADQVILGVLKFIPREDPLTLMKAFEQVLQSFPHTHLILVGDGNLRSEINDYVSYHSLRHVHLPGYAQYSQLPTYFAMADIFVHPAREEPWGVSINEAMICGLPVIAADTVGAAHDLLEDGMAGLMFRAGELSSLVTQLKSLLGDPALRNRMSQHAVKCASKWSYNLTIEQVRSALQYVRRRESSDIRGACDRP